MSSFVFWFGKHKGRPLEQVIFSDPSYAVWYLKETNSKSYTTAFNKLADKLKARSTTVKCARCSRLATGYLLERDPQGVFANRSEPSCGSCEVEHWESRQFFAANMDGLMDFCRHEKTRAQAKRFGRMVASFFGGGEKHRRLTRSVAMAIFA
jgi:hypothetical protein